MPEDFFTDVSLSQEKALSYSLPNLLIECSGQLIQFAYNNQTQKYESQTTVDLEETPSHGRFSKLIALSDSIILAKNIDSRLNQEQTHQSESKVIKISQSLAKLKVYECSPIAAMAVDRNHIFICTEGKLVALNSDLECLGKVNLNLESERRGTNKNAHAILIDRSIAYLLDNIIEPTYILRVDISNPSHLQILATFDIHGINHHLTGQWINPDLNQWCILQSYGSQAGSGENIIILPLNLDTGSVDLRKSQFPFQRSYLNERSILGYQSIRYASFDYSEEWGFNLIAVTSLPPIWGLIYEKRKRLYLAEIQTDNHQINFQNKLDLGELKDYYHLKARIMPIDQLLFLVVQEYTNQRSFTRLLVIDIAKKPSIILNQNLEVQNLYNSTMSDLLLPQN
ncbi:hypothetical protein ACL6C3_21315 [Capilliphycus salinus ALCB114379]|uniref:hypothetical protein n=1 Tax=Capilliphycus salinus TaxID=2768948 RepID=UPI0039A5DF73